jgi:hypothetical protein
MSAGNDKTGRGETLASMGGTDTRPDVVRLRELIDVAEGAIGTLRGRCDDAAAAISTLRDRSEDAEEAKAHLARLAVASARLHESDVEADSLRNLQDVLVNLIGTEQIAVWSLSADGRSLALRASQGIDSGPWKQVAVDQGLLGKAASSGEVVTEEQPGGGQPSVCIPLLVGRRLVGVVAVFRLLPHRGRLGRRDNDVFQLVSLQAGFALLCSGEPWGPARKVGDG